MIRIGWALAALTIATLPSAGQPQASRGATPYTAFGSEPFWGLEISAGRMHYSVNDVEIWARTPARRPLRGGGYRYATRRLVVEIRPERCEDEGERTHSDSVRVIADGVTVEGCGGRLLPPATLTFTDWRILMIDGAAVGAADADTYVLQFDEGRLLGHAGCNRLSGPYRQRGRQLTAGPIAATRMACPGPRMTHERAVLRLLGGPVRIAFPAGDIMVLTGSGVTVRLERT